MPLTQEQLIFNLSFSNLEKVNDRITKARVSIFYKGLNRNGTFITDSAATSLINSLSYAPVKGIYSELSEDFKNHKVSIQDGKLEKIYGVVPAEKNFAWEARQDKDGETRTYATADVFLWTGIYSESDKIIGKSQSMEIDPDTVEGSWSIMGGRKVFQFTNAEFLGLQILGDDVAPCFQGATFFSQITEETKTNEELIELLTEFSIKEEERMGKDNKIVESTTTTDEKQKTEFALSHEDIREKIYSQLETHYDTNEEYYGIAVVYDTYFIAVEYGTYRFFKVGYTKKEDNTIAIEGKDNAVEVFSEFVTAEEKAELESKQTELETNYATLQEEKEKLETNYTELEKTNKELETNYAKLEENHSTINSEFETKKTEFEAEKTTLELNNNSLQEENKSLREFKLSVERKEKKDVVANFSKVLNTEIIEKYSAEDVLDEISLENLEKELSYQLVTNNKEKIFNEKDDIEVEFSLFPKTDKNNNSSTNEDDELLVQAIKKTINNK